MWSAHTCKILPDDTFAFLLKEIVPLEMQYARDRWLSHL